MKRTIGLVAVLPVAWGVFQTYRYSSHKSKGTRGLEGEAGFLEVGGSVVSIQNQFRSGNRTVSVVPIPPVARKSFFDSVVEDASRDTTVVVPVAVPHVTDLRDIAPSHRELAVKIGHKLTPSPPTSATPPSMIELTKRGDFKSAVGSAYFLDKVRCTSSHIAVAVDTDANQFRYPEPKTLAQGQTKELLASLPKILSHTNNNLLIATPDGPSAAAVAGFLKGNGFSAVGESISRRALN